MTEQSKRDAAAERPRVWWSPTKGVIEELPPRYPGEPPRYVRTNDMMRHVIDVPADAVELVPAEPAPSGDVVETVADALAEVRLQIGPNTRSLIADGHWKQMRLSVSERRQIAKIAIAVTPRPVVSREQLIDHLTHIRVDNLAPVDGVVYINAESMADAIVILLCNNGIEVH